MKHVLFRFRHIFVLFPGLIFCLLLSGCQSGRQETSVPEETWTEPVYEATVELYVYNPCEACREEENFEDAVRQIVSEACPDRKLLYRGYNIFKTSDRAYLESRLQEAGLDADEAEPPFALVGNELYEGSYEEVGAKISAALNTQIRENAGAVESAEAEEGAETEKSAEEESSTAAEEGTGTVTEAEDKGSESGPAADSGGTDSGGAGQIRQRVENAGETESVLLLFTTWSCESCEGVKEYLNNTLQEEYMLAEEAGGQTTTVTLLECSIMEPENLRLLEQLMESRQVPDEKQQVPILFFAGGYLSGEAEIKEKLTGEIVSGNALGMSLEGLTDAEAEKGTEAEGGKMGLWQAAAAGLAGGLNPCAASMLFMVLSLLLVRGKGFLRGSFSYMAGKFAAYMGMGMGLAGLLSLVEESSFLRFQRILSVIFALLALFLGILNLLDFWNARKQEYGKIRAQLPEGLRRLNHRLIRKLQEVPDAWLIPALFVLGAVISAGEFFCAGQIYAASVFYMVSTGSAGFRVFLLLAVFVLCMCLVQTVFILIVCKTGNLFKVSGMMREGMPVIKLIYAVFFLLLFVLLLF